MSPQLKIHIGTAALTAVILSINYSQFAFLKSFHHSWNDILIVTLAGQNFAVTYLMTQKSLDQGKNFPILVIISFTFRLLVAITFLATMWLLEVGQLEALAINLVVLYLVFLVFELSALLTTLRPNGQIQTRG